MFDSQVKLDAYGTATFEWLYKLKYDSRLNVSLSLICWAKSDLYELLSIASLFTRY